MDLRKKDKEADKIPQLVRTARFVETDEGWYFRTREGIMLGPYAGKFDAEVSASLLVARLAQLEDGVDPAATIQAFETDPANATIVQTLEKKPFDLKAIKRKHQIAAAKGTLQKAWTAISQLKSIPKAKGPRASS
jgi:uncharacterized protein DUF6316